MFRRTIFRRVAQTMTGLQHTSRVVPSSVPEIVVPAIMRNYSALQRAATVDVLTSSTHKRTGRISQAFAKKYRNYIAGIIEKSEFHKGVTGLVGRVKKAYAESNIEDTQELQGIVDLDKHTNHLKTISYVSGQHLTGAEIKAKIATMMKMSPDIKRAEMFRFIQDLGFYPYKAQLKELNEFIDQLASKETVEEVINLLIDKYHEEQCLDITRDNFDKVDFVYYARVIANMTLMTDHYTTGTAEESHFGQRVDPKDRPPDSKKIFYSPLLQPNGNLPTDFSEYCSFYKLTNTGNVEDELAKTKEISIFEIQKGAKVIQQQVVRAGVGKTDYTECACRHEDKKPIIKVNLENNFPIDLGGGYFAIISYTDAFALKQKFNKVRFKQERTMNIQDMEEAATIARNFIIEKSKAKGVCTIKVFKGRDRIAIYDFSKELAPSLSEEQQRPDM